MKDLKLFILTISLVICSFAVQSCKKDEPVRLYDAIVTVKPSEDHSSVAFQLDEDTVVYPVNMKGSDFSPTEQRALINYREPTADECNLFDSRGPMIYVNWLQFILTKDMVPDLGPEDNEVEYGNDPVELVNDWVTLAEDGYLNLRFRTLWGNTGISHIVNLVYTPEEDNPYCVTFFHDAKGDYRLYEDDGIVAFRLEDLPDTGGQTVDLKVKWQSFSGPKQAIFNYRSR